VGLRGPGAKPIARKAGATVPRRQRRRPWEKPWQDRAERVIAFVRSLRITSGVHAGRRFPLRPWQVEIIRSIYRTGDDGRRIVREALITLPRKNGKSQLGAALALAHLAGPEAEPRGQVYSAAVDRAQAGLIFSELEAFVLADSTLAARCNIQRFAKRIEDAVTGSVYQALSADARKAHGLGASFAIYDELAQAPNRHLFDALRTSMGARAAGLMVVISTQSSDPHHVMTELVDHGRKVLDGTIEDPAFHATIYAAPADVDPWDEATWHAANPALGDFRSLEEMRTMAARARRVPALESVFRALYLNQPVDSDNRFLASADWDACAAKPDLAALAGRPCWGGLDLGSTQDLSSVVLIFPDDADPPTFNVLAWFWTAADTIAERADRDRVPYQVWRDQGLIEATPGRAIDKGFIVRRLGELLATYDVRVIAYDRWRIEELKKALADEGIEARLIAWGQGFASMAGAVDSLETVVLNGRLRHGGNPVLRWNASNAAIALDPAGLRKLDKAKSIGRIDGLVALAMALGIYHRDAAAPSVYEKRGLIALDF
jgi:phage terminase large subunit-like protein